ncbi:MAG: response regulator [Planctomycetes bacterium]|nr:response regulator [Planctomycetota bacterium]
MKKNAVILIAEDDRGHFELVKRNLWLNYVNNEILHFKDGQDILDFLYQTGSGPKREDSESYILLLDIRMPKVDGREVLKQIKEDPQLRKIPVIMLTTTSEAQEINQCYEMGCSFYMVKPVNYNKFMEAVESLGVFLSLEGVHVSPVNSNAN